jgi:asparagine synthase (glutamine-hydrolysing)
MRKNLAAARRLGLSPSREAEAVVEELSSAGDFGEYLRRVFRINQQDALVRQHLEIVDKYSMAAGLELRVPFMDHELVEYVNRLPLGLKASRALGVAKYILKRLALHAYGGRLTDVVLREKLGFPSAGARHLARFDELCEKMLPADYAGRHAWGSYFPGKRHLVMFDLFCDFFLERRGRVPPGFDIVAYLREKAAA